MAFIPQGLVNSLQGSWQWNYTFTDMANCTYRDDFFWERVETTSMENCFIKVLTFSVWFEESNLCVCNTWNINRNGALVTPDLMVSWLICIGVLFFMLDYSNRSRLMSDRLPLFQQMSSPFHDDVIKWKHFPRYWPFVRGIHWSPVNSPHKGQWRGALVFSLICVWMNSWVNNREAGDLRRYRAHYDVTVMA